MYAIVDIQTGERVGHVYDTRRAAQRRADRMDNDYGAVRYVVRFLGERA